MLILKSFIDFPFALMFGMLYGKQVAFSAIPVALIQLFIFFIALCAKNYITADLMAQLNSVGYIILFFSGFNLICDEKYRINNLNMLWGMLLVTVFNLVFIIWR